MRKLIFALVVIVAFTSCSNNTEVSSTDSTVCNSCAVDSTNTVDTVSVDTVVAK
jgi:hypothetical protein